MAAAPLQRAVKSSTHLFRLPVSGVRVAGGVFLVLGGIRRRVATGAKGVAMQGVTQH